MKTRITFEVDEDVRKAVAHHYGQVGLADYSSCKSWIENETNATLDDMALQVAEDREETRMLDAGEAARLDDEATHDHI